MKRAAVRPHKQPLAWGDFEYAELHDSSVDDLDRHLDGMALDPEDRHPVVEVILHRVIHGAG
jgi:hypothetical protein